MEDLNILCSSCFTDEGLRLDAIRLGQPENSPCPNCGTSQSSKLDREVVATIAHRFFVRGTLQRFDYGAAPGVQFNEHRYGTGDLNPPDWLRKDVKLIEDTLKIGFFRYGPRFWMFGEVEPLKALQEEDGRETIISRIVNEYPARLLHPDETVYRLRVNPEEPTDIREYDSPPEKFLGTGRLDSPGFPVLYCSQDIEGTVHECRATMEDDLFLASILPVRTLRLLDLTEVLQEETTEFDSLDMTVHMLFFARAHSYGISRAVASRVHDAGYDGLLYPSYFSQVRNCVPFATVYGLSVRLFPSYRSHAKAELASNICLFGRPIEQGHLRVKCIDRLIINRTMYDIQFGPVTY